MSEEQTFTPGPWGWFGTPSHGFYLATVTGGRRYVMQFRRMGMAGAQPVFQVNDRMVPAKELCIFEVSRDVTSNRDPSVYRDDIVGFRSADARLIAAAPELLAPLKAFVANYPHGLNPFLDDACNAARAALAKAEGR